MKIFFLLLLAFFLHINNFAQSTFPLDSGNTWYYQIDYFFYDPPKPSTYFIFKIVDDTIMVNNKSYWVIEPYDMFLQKYIRCDSGYIYYWDRFCNNGEGCEIKFVNLNAQVGISDTINWYGYYLATLESVYSLTIFNDSTNWYKYRLTGLTFADITLSEKFGYVGFSYYGDYQWEQDHWSLKGCIISDTLYGQMVDVKPDDNFLPDKMELFQNYPNPFNPSTKIKFTIPNVETRHASSVQRTVLKVYDVLGNEVTTLVNEEKFSGIYEVEFHASSLSSGIYFYELKAGNFIQTRKMILIK